MLRDFGTNLKLERVRRRMNQAEFGKLIGLHRTFVGQLERGQRGCNLIEFVHIVNVLAVEPQTLLQGLIGTPRYQEKPYDTGA